MNNRFNQKLNTINDVVASIFFVAMFITVFTSVVLRYFFGFSFRWTEELTRYLFIYMVFLAIPIAFRENIHAAIEYFRSTFLKKINHILQIFCDLLIGITVTYIGYSTIIMIRGRLGRTLSSGLKLPFGYIYSAVLFCIGLLLIEIIQGFIIKGYRQQNTFIDKDGFLRG